MLQLNYNIDPEHEFKYELSCIQNEFYYKIAVDALRKAPDYFWFVPASSSGKYHPTSSLGIGGLIRHVKAVFRISEELLNHKLYGAYTEAEKDEIRVAILLHDAMKQGTEGKHTVSEHPLLVRDALSPWKDIKEDEAIDGRVSTAWNNICMLIETHMGIWNTDRNGAQIMDIPRSRAQLHVHMCDYLASRKQIEVDTTPREPQAPTQNTNKTDLQAWKNEPATEAQVTYIKSLASEAQNRGLIKNITIHPNVTKGDASTAIENLSKLLGKNKQ
jgi:hypothetical protein